MSLRTSACHYRSHKVITDVTDDLTDTKYNPYPVNIFWVLQTFERKRLAKVKIMGTKTIYNRMFLKRFMYTVY